MQNNKTIKSFMISQTNRNEKILNCFDTGLLKYPDTCFPRIGINQMWILKKIQKTCWRL